MNFQVGDWVEIDTHLYTQARKGTIGYVDDVAGDELYFRPTHHPDGKFLNVNSKFVKKWHVKPLAAELAEDELDAFIDLALLEKDEQAFYELLSRKGG